MPARWRRARDHKLQEAAVKKAVGKDKRKQQDLQASDAARALVDLARAGPVIWAKLALPSLKLAFKGLNGLAVDLKGTKKADFVLALTPLLTARLAAPVAPALAAAGAADGAAPSAPADSDSEASDSDSDDSDLEAISNEMDVDDM